MTTARSLRRKRVVAAFALAASSTALLVAGCNIGAPAAYAIFGPGKIGAEHELAKSRTVVFVDDRQNVLPRAVLRATIGAKISEELLSQKLIPSAVDPRQAIQLTRQREDGAKPLSIAAIGRELECQQVVYVQITSYTLIGDGSFGAPGGTTGAGATPTARATVKVIDVVTNRRTYPADAWGAPLGLGSASGPATSTTPPSVASSGTPGREITAVLREVDPSKLQTVAQRRTVEDLLAAELGGRIAMLFYEHERIELGEHLGPR